MPTTLYHIFSGRFELSLTKIHQESLQVLSTLIQTFIMVLSATAIDPTGEKDVKYHDSGTNGFLSPSTTVCSGYDYGSALDSTLCAIEGEGME